MLRDPVTAFEFNRVLWLGLFSVRKTAESLKEEGEDYDSDESLQRAISMRKYLLNRLVPDDPPLDDDDESDGG